MGHRYNCRICISVSPGAAVSCRSLSGSAAARPLKARAHVKRFRKIAMVTVTVVVMVISISILILMALAHGAAAGWIKWNGKLK